MRKRNPSTLLTLGLALLALPASALAASYPATDPAIHYEGRWQEAADGCYETAQGAVYLETAFTGTGDRKSVV